jgi:glycosyltransferase involved in cell wall biosynthesis
LIPIEKYSQIKKTRVLNKYLTGVQCRKENGKIRLVKTKTGSYLPNGIDLLNPNVYDPIRVLWMGSNTHDGDLECIVPVVKEIGKRYGLAVRFVFFGYCPDEFIYNTMDRGNIHTGMAVKDEYQSFVDYVQGVSHEHYHKVFNQIQADIGICPLSEHEFNLSKSNIKPLELGARRIPSIVTDFGPYQFIQNRVNGIKVKNKTEEWVNALAELIEDVHTRIRLGDAILSTVSQDYSWSSDCVGRQMWDEAFKLCRSQMLAIRTQKQEEFNNSPIRTTDED